MAAIHGNPALPIARKTLPLNPSFLMISASAVSFGDVELKTAATQEVTVTSTTGADVTLDSAMISGLGFSLPEAGFPATLTPGASLVLNLQFAPDAAGEASGQLVVSSASFPGGAATVILTGTGVEPEVELAWNAPDAPIDPAAGYKVYRAPHSGSEYQLLGASAGAAMSYADATVQSGQSYDYYVTSVDGEGNESLPSIVITLAIP